MGRIRQTIDDVFDAVDETAHRYLDPLTQWAEPKDIYRRHAENARWDAYMGHGFMKIVNMYVPGPLLYKECKSVHAMDIPKSERCLRYARAVGHEAFMMVCRIGFFAWMYGLYRLDCYVTSHLHHLQR